MADLGADSLQVLVRCPVELAHLVTSSVAAIVCPARAEELAMPKAQTTTIIDLGRLSLSFGEGARLDLGIRLDPIELGGQVYAPAPASVKARLDISRPSNGYAFRLRFPLRVEGPCMRCLEMAGVETEVEAREVDFERLLELGIVFTQGPRVCRIVVHFYEPLKQIGHLSFFS